MTHDELQDAITGICDSYGLTWHHHGDSTRDTGTNGGRGWPDLVIMGPGGALFAEVKSESGRRTRDQIRTARAVIAAGLQYREWRPQHWRLGVIHRELAALR